MAFATIACRFKSVIGLPMISPFSKFSLVWHMLMLVLDLTCETLLKYILLEFLPT